MSANRQPTFDDSEPVLERGPQETVIGPKGVKPRSRNALQVYEKLQELKNLRNDIRRDPEPFPH